MVVFDDELSIVHTSIKRDNVEYKRDMCDCIKWDIDLKECSECWCLLVILYRTCVVCVCVCGGGGAGGICDSIAIVWIELKLYTCCIARALV